MQLSKSFFLNDFRNQLLQDIFWLLQVFSFFISDLIMGTSLYL